MKKMKTVFVMDRSSRPHTCTREVQEQWVLDGEGVATVKVDGTSCLIRDGRLYKRFDAKEGRAIPEGFEPCEETRDPETGHWPGWVLVGEGPEDKWHRAAFVEGLKDGTYELIGPKVQGNRYGIEWHTLVRHGAEEVVVERSYEGLRAWLEKNEVEGLVFHHPDGRMAKLRRKDFGLKW
ncbi:MAG: hypothetical protein CL472_07270 [Acidobacteria bacterium]|nr:hypothetical protein [Acidobacteriota bacterium]